MNTTDPDKKILDLATHGDDFERQAYPLFVKEKFPSYEIFWQQFIVPLTNKPTDIHTKNDLELKIQFPYVTIEQIHEQIAILQLHYSVLGMLLKAYKKRKIAEQDIDAVEGCFSHLYSALDIAAELFGRYYLVKTNSPISVSAFDPKIFENNSKKIRKDWQDEHPYPNEIRIIRKYRNLMLHGSMFGIIESDVSRFIVLPKPDKVLEHLDWRKLHEALKYPDDRSYSKHIVDDAFEKVITYLNQEWTDHLL